MSEHIVTAHGGTASDPYLVLKWITTGQRSMSTEWVAVKDPRWKLDAVGRLQI